MSLDEFRRQIVAGSANKAMPAFNGALSAEQIDAVVEYIRAMGVDEPPKQY